MKDRQSRDRRRQQQDALDRRIRRVVQAHLGGALPPAGRARVEDAMRDVVGARGRLRQDSRSEHAVAAELTQQLQSQLIDPEAALEIAREGVATGAKDYPYREDLQPLFGRHDISDISAHGGSQATKAAEFLGANAYAYGSQVVFRGAPDLWTAAHEAAHVVQQRAGVSLTGGVGTAGDRYEHHADAVADQVVQGKSVEGLLDQVTGASSRTNSVAAPVVQRSIGLQAVMQAVAWVTSEVVDYATGSDTEDIEGSAPLEESAEHAEQSTETVTSETAPTVAGPLTAAEQEKLASWLESGRRDLSPMTDELFYARHPESRGTALEKGSDLANEWVDLHAVVKRAVDMLPQGKSGEAGEFIVTEDVEERAVQAIHDHMGTLDPLPEWSYQASTKSGGGDHADWLMKLRDTAFFAGFPDAKGKEKEAGYGGAWNVICEEVVPRTLNAIYTAGQDPTQATSDVDEDIQVGLTDIDCDSPRLKELLTYERLPHDLTAEAYALIEEEPVTKQPAQYEALQSKVYYSNQRDNAAYYEDSWGGTCNLTSLAMAMQAGGIPNPDPAMQYEEALLAMALDRGVMGSITSRTAWDAVVKGSGGKSKMVAGQKKVVTAQDDGTNKTSWEDQIHKKAFWVDTVQGEYLQKGWGVIISLAGHIVRLEAVTDTGLRVDDPFGKTQIGQPDKGSKNRQYRTKEKNSASRDRSDAGYNKGENIVYPWADVEKHRMRTVYAVQAKGRPRRRKDSLKAAAYGVGGSSSRLPFSQTIQPLFGRHNISGIRAHVGDRAATAAEYIGAQAYASGQHIAFQKAPDLHTAAHEAAHIIQQRGGVSLQGGMGRAGDSYERHADAVADLVVQGKSAEALLDTMSGTGSASTAAPVVQRLPADQTTWAVPASSSESTYESSQVSPKAASTKSSMGFMDMLHGALDAAGMVPALGIIPDGINALIYIAEGDVAGAGFSAAAMVPIFGQGATATKYTVKVGGELVERTAVRVTKEGVEQMGQEGIEQGLKRAKSAAGAGKKAAKAAGSTPLLPMTTKQLQRKYKHAADFGVVGNYNRANGEMFADAITRHVSGPGTKKISGTYRGNPVTHYVDSQTGLNVIVDASGNFLSGWKLNPAQLQNILRHGGL